MSARRRQVEPCEVVRHCLAFLLLLPVCMSHQFPREPRFRKPVICVCVCTGADSLLWYVNLTHFLRAHPQILTLIIKVRERGQNAAAAAAAATPR